MLDPQQTPYRASLGNGLSMRTAADESDVERVAQLNGTIHGPGVAGMARSLALHYAGMSGRDFVLVEDEHVGQVVSTICLVPWTMCYEGIPLSVGEMGLVGTLEAYRRQGLVRAQVGWFKHRLAERGCLISTIAGIPYFYRQYGYEYALPLEGGLRYTSRDLPPPPAGPFAFRAATPEDIPVLARLYDDAARDLAIHAARDSSRWEYLLANTIGTEMEAETLLLSGGDGEVIGYLRLPAHHFGDELAASEVSRLPYEAALAALHWLAKQAEERRTPGVRLNLPAGCTLMRLARSFGAHDLGTYAWQIHIPDMAAFLRAIGPALERRIAASPFAGLTRDVQLGFYRDSVILHFVCGRLVEIAAGGPAEDEISFPPLSFIPLLLGHRPLDELRAAYPDIHVDRAWRMLLETLFPALPAFIYPAY